MQNAKYKKPLRSGGNSKAEKGAIRVKYPISVSSRNSLFYPRNFILITAYGHSDFTAMAVVADFHRAFLILAQGLALTDSVVAEPHTEPWFFILQCRISDDLIISNRREFVKPFQKNRKIILSFSS